MNITVRHCHIVWPPREQVKNKGRISIQTKHFRFERNDSVFYPEMLPVHPFSFACCTAMDAPEVEGVRARTKIQQ